ncbi:hypothetical protein BJV77DRAFT_240274 [Russula vinacea]|nr:hypothetical protein BJV77DRAFT_240274 [Russula vinacea]
MFSGWRIPYVRRMSTPAVDQGLRPQASDLRPRETVTTITHDTNPDPEFLETRGIAEGRGCKRPSSQITPDCTRRAVTSRLLSWKAVPFYRRLLLRHSRISSPHLNLILHATNDVLTTPREPMATQLFNSHADPNSNSPTYGDSLCRLSSNI